MSAVALLNAVANQPEVLRKIAPQHQTLDCAAFFTDPRNVMLGDERGVMLFFWIAEGAYDAHFLFTDALRGPAALKTAKSMLCTMFTCHGATVICGSVPRDYRASRAMCRALGCRPTGTFTTSGRAYITYAIERAQCLTSSVESSAETNPPKLVKTPPKQPLPATIT